MEAIIIIPIVLGFVHLINWLMVKGIIWVIYELANVNWYSKFWVVYIALFIIESIFKSVFSIQRK